MQKTSSQKKQTNKLALFITIIVLVLVILFFSGVFTPQIATPDVVANPVELVARDRAVLIDVRTDEEWDESHAQYAEHFELARLENGELPDDIDPDDEVYLYCRSGRRAGIAEGIMHEAGYTNITNFGGLTDWITLGGELASGIE